MSTYSIFITNMDISNGDLNKKSYLSEVEYQDFLEKQLYQFNIHQSLNRSFFNIIPVNYIFFLSGN